MAQQGAASAMEPEYVPGTVHLVDLEHRIHARHAKGKNEELVLVPAPSSDPDDPLNVSEQLRLPFLPILFYQPQVITRQKLSKLIQT